MTNLQELKKDYPSLWCSFIITDKYLSLLERHNLSDDDIYDYFLDFIDAEESNL